MGRLEHEVAKQLRKTKIQQAILATVAGVGLLAVALLAPNVLQLFGKRRWQKPASGSIRQSRYRLVKLGLLEYQNGFLRLTQRGKMVLQNLELRDYQLQKPKRWDGKWRVLIFDIYESHKSIRNRLRLTLTAVGFQRLQDSVWVYPYDCEDFITLLKADFKIGREVLYLIVDKIENDKWLRRDFDLPMP